MGYINIMKFSHCDLKITPLPPKKNNLWVPITLPTLVKIREFLLKKILSSEDYI